MGKCHGGPCGGGVLGDIRKRYKAQGREEPQGLELGQTAQRIVQKMLESALELSECQTQIAQQKQYTVQHLQSELEDRLSQSVEVQVSRFSNRCSLKASVNRNGTCTLRVD